MSEPIRVLLIEDDHEDFVLFSHMLRKIDVVETVLSWVSTSAGIAAGVREQHDIIFVDYLLGERTGVDVIKTLRDEGDPAPAILLTGHDERRVDICAMSAGAADYLVKSDLSPAVLERAIRYALERKRAAVALRESQKQLEDTVSLLRATLEASADGILVTNSRGKFVDANRRLPQLLGLPADASLDEIRARFRQELENAKSPDEVRQRLSELRANPELESDDELEFKDGRSFERHSRPQWSGGEIVGRVWTFREVTERRKMQASLVAADRLASMGALAAGVAHEINTPLTYVMANLSMLGIELKDSGTVPDEARRSELSELLHDASDGAQRVRRVVRELRVFSRTDDLVTGPVDLHQVIEFAVNMAFNEIRHRARLVKDYDSNIPLVEGNEGKLGQVFLNLLVNAAQAIPEGNLDRNRIRIVTSIVGADQVGIEISDTGEGIAPEHLENIFRPFFTTKQIGVGTGLGLSISQGILASLGATIEVTSQIGHGTTFRVTLPRAKTDVIGGSSTPPALEPCTATSRCTIMVVDDDAKVGTAVRRLLGGEHNVVGLTSGVQALEYLDRGGAVDLILCDLMMPEMTGMDLYNRLLATAPAIADRMIFMTGGAFTPRAQKFIETVQNDKVEKPFDLHALMAIVRRRLSGRLAAPGGGDS